MARITPLSKAELIARNVDLSFVGTDFHELPNSVPTLAYRPEIMQAAGGLWTAVMGPGTVDRGLKWLVGYMVSMAAGCRYCSAHTATGANSCGVSAEKIEAVWDYERSDLYSLAERAAIDVARLAGQVPNAVGDADFAALEQHFSVEQMVEIVSAIAVYGFFNRFNDTVGTELEATPRKFAESHLVGHGWEIGCHR